MSFVNHFGQVSQQYAQSRPTYPQELATWIASESPSHDIAWDCACGSGQMTHTLAKAFDSVVASDASQEQLSHFSAVPNVTLKHAEATETMIEPASCDAVVVAQALHYFPTDDFFQAVERSLKPGGVFCAVAYELFRSHSAAFDAAIDTLYSEIVGDYWPPNRRHIEAGYRTITFPSDWREITVPRFTMEVSWTLADTIGYLRSWSAVGHYVKAKDADPIEHVAEALERGWGDPAHRQVIRWPLVVRAMRGDNG